MDPMIYYGAAMVLGACAFILVGMSRQRAAGGVDIEQRLATFGGRVDTLEDRELAESFSTRVIKPAIQKAALRLGRLTPASNLDKVKQRLTEAGNPSGLGAIEFNGLRFLLLISLGVGTFLLLSLSGGGGTTILISASLGGFGFMLPGIWLSRKGKARKKEIVRALPDAIDLLTISVESGLGFDPALLRVAEKWDNALTREFARMLSEMRIGKSKREALREMADRCGIDDLSVFVSSVIQADQLGVAIAQVLRIQSEAMRMRRRQRAEEAAHKAPIKMLFPMVFLIFPALYVIILGPAVPQIVEAFK
ncbi:MAG: type II secretion system F family protein [Thermomicrobiales bacterium]